MSRIGMDRVHAYEEEMGGYLYEELSRVDGVRALGSPRVHPHTDLTPPLPVGPLKRIVCFPVCRCESTGPSPAPPLGAAPRLRRSMSKGSMPRMCR